MDRVAPFFDSQCSSVCYNMKLTDRVLMVSRSSFGDLSPPHPPLFIGRFPHFLRPRFLEEHLEVSDTSVDALPVARPTWHNKESP